MVAKNICSLDLFLPKAPKAAKGKKAQSEELQQWRLQRRQQHEQDEQLQLQQLSVEEQQAIASMQMSGLPCEGAGLCQNPKCGCGSV